MKNGSVEYPLVSVLITAYNREKYISEAIESVLTSTYTNFELIILDDCSNDRTVEIAEGFALMDPRIRVYVNENNLGDYRNRNKVAEYAKGKYIKYCDSDDKIFDWTLDYCVEMMEKHPDAGMGILNLNEELKQEYLKPKDAININFFQKEILAIGPSGTILRQDAFAKIGYFNPYYGPASDMYFNLKMASAFPIVLLNKLFFFYRVHGGQQIQNKYGYVCYNYKYIKDILTYEGLPLTKEQKFYLLKKAKRSFVNIFLVYLRQTWNFSKALKAYKISEIGLKGFLRGVSLNASFLKIKRKGD
jgi:glycosyltransferase involved in cell wall biosynthesis